MDKTSAATADSRPQSPPEEEPQASERRLALACGTGTCLRLAALASVAYSFAATAWRVRGDPPELAFVAGAGALLAALSACLRRAEGLTPASPAGERRRVRAAVWVLSTVLSGAFAYRVAAVMPPALAVVVWCMTAFVVLAGFYLLVLCEVQDQDQQYQALPDGKAAVSAKIGPSDELV